MRLHAQNMRTTWQYFTENKGLVVAAGIFLASICTLAGLTVASRSQAVSCDKVNIIYCGVADAADLQKVYASNKSGHASSPTVKKDYTDVKKIYAAMGIDAAEIKGMKPSNTKAGVVYRDGTVKVDGKIVGTDARVAARFSVAGAQQISGTNAYIRRVTDSFSQPSRIAMVYIKDGKMQWAVIADCGNPVTATPPATTPPKTTPPKTPPVTPPETPPKTPPTPPTPTPPKTHAAKKCEGLRIARQIDRNTYEFEAKGSASGGATLVGYKFDFGDGQNQTLNSGETSVTTNHRYAEAKDYTVTVAALVTTADSTEPTEVTGKECAVQLTVQPPATPPPTPPTPVTPEQPKEIAATGASAVAGLTSFAGLGGALSYYFTSRRNLKEWLLQH